MCDCDNNSSGCNCFSGITIPVGPKGDKGDTGEQGTQGIQGIQGIQGETGHAGPAGPQGPAGTNGATGPAGPTGPQGGTGVDGSVGPQGIPGPQGATGITGDVGTQGDPGVNAYSLNNYLSGATADVIPVASAVIPGMSDVAGNGSGDYKLIYELYITDALPDKIDVKVGGATVDTLDLAAWGVTGVQNISGVWVGNVNDTEPVEVWAEDASNTAVVQAFKMALFRLG